MSKSRSGHLFDYAAQLRFTPFLLFNADAPILRYQNPIYSRNKHKMNNFCLWSIFVRVCVIQPPFGAMLFPRPTTYKHAKRASYNLRRRASYNLGGNTPVEWHDALPFSCVMFTVPVRHQPISFNSLSYMHTPPPSFSTDLPDRALTLAKITHSLLQR